MVHRDVRHVEDFFDYAFNAVVDTPGHNGWTVHDTGTDPTFGTKEQAGGGFELLLGATAEAQVLTLFQNDKKLLKLEDLQNIEWQFEANDIGANTVLSVGFGSDRADDEDTVTRGCETGGCAHAAHSATDNYSVVSFFRHAR